MARSKRKRFLPSIHCPAGDLLGNSAGRKDADACLSRQLRPGERRDLRPLVAFLAEHRAAISRDGVFIIPALKGAIAKSSASEQNSAFSVFHSRKDSTHQLYQSTPGGNSSVTMPCHTVDRNGVEEALPHGAVGDVGPPGPGSGRSIVSSQSNLGNGRLPFVERFVFCFQ